MAKFRDGDKVQMTPETRAANPDSRSFTGVVVGRARFPQEVRIRKDGQKTVTLWHETAWELRSDQTSEDQPDEQ